MSPRGEQKGVAMSTTQLIHSPARSATRRPVGTRGRGFASPDRPTPGERFDETAPLIGAPAIYGPPIIFLLGPWLLLVLLLVPPAALLITLALVAAVAAGLLVALGALVASPYLLVRHLHARHSAHRRPAASVHRPAHPAPAVSEVAGPRGWRPVRQTAGAHLVHLTAR